MAAFSVFLALLYPPTHQVQHRLHDVPVANLPDLDQAHQHGEFHLDIPDRDGGVDHPGREDHRAGWRHHPFPGGAGASARGDLLLLLRRRRLLRGGARRRVGVSVCVRERRSRARWCWNRLLARHFPLETGRRGAVAAVSHTCSTSCVCCRKKTIHCAGRKKKNKKKNKGRAAVLKKKQQNPQKITLSSWKRVGIHRAGEKDGGLTEW